ECGDPSLIAMASTPRSRGKRRRLACPEPEKSNSRRLSIHRASFPMATLSNSRLGYLPRGMAILFACGLLAIVLDALLLHFITSYISDTTHEIIAARARADQFDAAHDSLMDAEAAARGFLLTGRTENLEPYTAAGTRAKNLLDALAAMPRDNPGEQARAEAFAR